MKIIYFTLILVYILSLIARISSTYVRNVNIIQFLIITIIIICFSGLRDGIGDTGAYVRSYEMLVNNPSSVNLEHDFGFNLFQLFLTTISSNPQILIFITAFITCLFNMITFRKYPYLYELQIYMYITSGYYLLTMNGIRQCMVAAILFWSSKYIIDGNLKIYLFIVLIMSTFHASAIIMIPLYFIVRKPAWLKNTMILIIISLLCFIFFSEVMEILFNSIEGSQYSHYEEYILQSEQGASILRVLIAAVPVCLSYLQKESIKENFKEGDIFVNFALINLLIYILSLFNWIFARFSIYTQLYNFILLPYMIYNIKDKKMYRLVYFLFIICYGLVFMKELNVEYHSVVLKSLIPSLF